MTSSSFFSLLVVSEITLFFDTKDLKYSTAFTLTIMLVMYTMYQSIVETMPKTAYLKLIDYWLLFCLMVPFLTFMVEVYWLMRESSSCDNIKKNKWMPMDFILQQRFVQILIPTFTIIFIFSFFLAAAIVGSFSG